MSSSRPVPTVHSIAGSVSGGGAGIQADLKAFARAGVHGMTAITSLTAQNTVGVTSVHPVPPAFVIEQVRVVADDLGVDAVKTGMLGTAETVEAVAEALDLLPEGTPLIVDPVMVAESGATLLDDPARRAVVERLLPRATVITPNLPEAAALAAVAGLDVPEDDAEALARALHGLGPGAVVVTGGHREEATDVYFDGERLELLPGERHADGAAHGSGCTHASSLAAFIALGAAPLEAARAAKKLAAAAVRDGLRELGAGPGPVDVFGLRHRDTLEGPVPEADIIDTPAGKRPAADGWFVLNLEGAAGHGGNGGGIATDLEPETGEWRQVGVNVHVLRPGEPACMYHAENKQEDFLVLAGEPLLIIEEHERRLRPWDFVHCPPGTRHVFVGAGSGPAAVLMIGARGDDEAVLYPVSEAAARHGASVEAPTDTGREAYRDWPSMGPEKFSWPI